jgi:glutaredoxin 3
MRGSLRHRPAAIIVPVMSEVRVYTKHHCPFCVRAKALLGRKGVAYREIDVEGDDGLRSWLVEQSGQRTVPQIFVGERPLGGYSDIEELDRLGKLDAILRGEV